MSGFNSNLRLLCLSLLGGRWDKNSLAVRIEHSLAGSPIDPTRLAARLIFHFDEGEPPSLPRLLACLSDQEDLRQWFAPGDHGRPPRILLDSPLMARPPNRLLTFPLPQLETSVDLARWLNLSDAELAWFADLERRQSRIERTALHHYRYRWLEKRSGSLRLIEIPKCRLKAVQRQILRGLLNRVPPHEAAHGFARGRSTLSYVEHHVGKPVLLRMDLKDFFHSVPVARIGAVFRTLGYPREVARLLQGLTTHCASAHLAGPEFQRLPWTQRRRLADKHLPQGAPASPALANLCAWRFDCRLQGLAEHYALDYSRYADDIAFSGGWELQRLAPFLQRLIGAIALEEGFEINHRKTRLQTQSHRQRLAGTVINQRPNLQRQEYDRLKATLHNAIHQGAERQNLKGHADFKAHLAGRIAYVAWLNPARGEKLKRLWERISWEDL